MFSAKISSAYTCALLIYGKNYEIIAIRVGIYLKYKYSQKQTDTPSLFRIIVFRVHDDL